jgi:hypothetical protein
MEFIYTDDVQLDMNISYDLLALADKYMLMRLKNICEEYLVSSSYTSHTVVEEHLTQERRRDRQPSRQVQCHRPQDSLDALPRR